MNTLRSKQFFSVLFFIERYFQYPQEVFWVSIMPAGKTGRETGRETGWESQLEVSH